MDQPTPSLFGARGKRWVHFGFFLVLLAFLSASVFAQSITWNDGTRKSSIRTLNIYRCMHGMTTAQWYKYSSCIEPFAQTHATYMATNNKFEHSGTSYNQKTCAPTGLGENIGAGRQSMDNVIKAFYAEIQYVNWSSPCDASKGTVGHFTSIMWKDATLFAAAGAYSSSSTYKYYWSSNNGSPTGSAPNTSSKCTSTMVPPLDTSVSQSSCEVSVLNYYNQNPAKYWESSGLDSNAPTLSNLNLSTTGSLGKGSQYTLSWDYSGSSAPTFNIVFCTGGLSGSCSTLASSIANSQRSASITIPSSAATDQYGILSVQTSTLNEIAYLAGLNIVDGGGGDGGDGGVTPIPTPTTYSWSSGKWGDCSNSSGCGTGTQTRTVQCQDANGSAAADSNCTSTKPSTSQSCQRQGTCQNGGTCNNNNGTCTCADGYSGTFCETKKDSTTPTSLTNLKITDSNGKSVDSFTLTKDYTASWDFSGEDSLTFNVYLQSGSTALPLKSSLANSQRSVTFTIPESIGASTSSLLVVSASDSTQLVSSKIPIYSYSYTYGDWGTCDSSTSTQTRTVSCTKTDGSTTKTVAVPDCTGTNAGTAQSLSQSCTPEVDPTPTPTPSPDKPDCGSAKKCANGGVINSSLNSAQTAYVCDDFCTCPSATFWSSPTSPPSETSKGCSVCSLSCSSDTAKSSGTPNAECTNCDCARGFFGVKCACNEVFMTLPFNNPPDYFISGSSNTDSKGATPDQITNQTKYFNTLGQLFASLTGYKSARFDLRQWNVDTVKGKRRIVTVWAVKTSCLDALNEYLASRHPVTANQDKDENTDKQPKAGSAAFVIGNTPYSHYPDRLSSMRGRPIQPLAKINDHKKPQLHPPLDQDHHESELLLQNVSTFRVLQADGTTPDFSDQNDVSEVYSTIDSLINKLISDPSLAGLIPTDSSSSSSSSSDTQKSAIDPNTTFSDVVYDPNATCDPTTSTLCPTNTTDPFSPSSTMKDETEDLTWVWILIGVVCGVLFLAILILTIVCICLDKCCCDMSRKDKTAPADELEPPSANAEQDAQRHSIEMMQKQRPSKEVEHLDL